MDLMEVVEVGKEAGYRRALDRIMHELGVPGDGYPANVANAWYIANAALNARAWSPGDEEHSSIGHTPPTVEQETGEEPYDSPN